MEACLTKGWTLLRSKVAPPSTVPTRLATRWLLLEVADWTRLVMLRLAPLVLRCELPLLLLMRPLLLLLLTKLMLRWDGPFFFALTARGVTLLRHFLIGFQVLFFKKGSKRNEKAKKVAVYYDWQPSCLLSFSRISRPDAVMISYKTVCFSRRNSDPPPRAGVFSVVCRLVVQCLKLTQINVPLRHPCCNRCTKRKYPPLSETRVWPQGMTALLPTGATSSAFRKTQRRRELIW